jgi:hypothetical protein
VVDGLGLGPHPGVDVGVALDVGARRVFGLAIGIEGGLGHHLAGDLHALADGAAVFLGRQVVGQDGRIVERIGRAQAHLAAALRAQLADVQGEAVLLDLGLAVVLHDRQHAVDLQVGPVEVGARLQEGAALQELLAAQALAHQHVGQAGAQLLQALVGRIGGDQVLGRPRQADVQVVLQVGADALGRVGHRDPLGPQVVRIADPRQLQDVRRLHGAGAEQHLGVGMGDEALRDWSRPRTRRRSPCRSRSGSGWCGPRSRRSGSAGSGPPSDRPPPRSSACRRGWSGRRGRSPPAGSR